jgi:hypothetical protein
MGIEAVYDCRSTLAEIEGNLPMGAALIPIVPRLKKPSVADWPGIRASDLQKPEFRALFVGETGIGMVCGQASKGLCFVDVDRDNLVEAVESASPELAGTVRIRGARGAKWLVRVEAPVRGFLLRDADGKRVGEFLGERQQGLLAGIHPVSGNPYQRLWRRQVPVVDPLQIGDLFKSLSPFSHD